MTFKKLHINRLFGCFALAAFLIFGAFNMTAEPAASRQANSKKIKVEKPDFAKISKDTQNPKSEYYYPKLLKIFLKNDTSMTHDQYRNLYLGYFFQEDYDPYRTSPYNATSDSILGIVKAQKERITKVTDSLNKLIKANKISGHEAEIQKKHLTDIYKRTLRELATATELSLKDNPFDLRQMSVLVHASREMGNTMKAKIWEYRLEHILGAIKSTGSGETQDNAFYVIYPMHEYNMIQLLGYEPVSVDFPADGFDYIAVRPDADSKRKGTRSAKGFYFNVGPMTEQYELKHPDSTENPDGSLFNNAEDFDDDSEATEDPDDIPAE
ncbi:MAG: DUF4919 domain-containing protein [Muribaculaceae bacterium]|nr:DUF4919 domain-containing protein [Muribaculaceae bacterium]